MIYTCTHCGDIKNSEHDGREVDPTNPSKIVCEQCADGINDREERLECERLEREELRSEYPRYTGKNHGSRPDHDMKDSDYF